MNKVILMGNMVFDPELKVTQSGISVTTFKVAVKRQGKQDVTDFIPCVAWRERAEFIQKYFHKGMKIALEGEMQIRTYDDKDGKKVYVTEVIVSQVYFCGPPPSSGQQQAQQSTFQQPVKQQSSYSRPAQPKLSALDVEFDSYLDGSSEEADDGDLPF